MRIGLGKAVRESWNTKTPLRCVKRCPLTDRFPPSWTAPRTSPRSTSCPRLSGQKPELKAVITSGYHTDTVGLEEAGADGILYLPKPCPLKKVLTTIAAMVGKGA
jgi:hypothetical protein